MNKMASRRAATALAAVFHPDSAHNAAGLPGCVTLSPMFFILAVFVAAQGSGAAPAAPEHLVLIDETVEVPRAAGRVFDLELRQRPVLVHCRFSVESGGSGVRLALLRRADSERLRAGKSHHVLAATAYRRSDDLRYPASEGDYSLIVDNGLEGRGSARVRLLVELVFADAQSTPVSLPAGRKAVVIVASILFFAGVVWYAGRKLRRAVLARFSHPDSP